MHLVQRAEDAGPLAAAADPTQRGVSGAGLRRPRCALIGARTPWRAVRPDARDRARESAQAALESVCFQTVDLLTAMNADWSKGDGADRILRVDGGMAASDWTMQRLADLTGSIFVDRPRINEDDCARRG